MRMSLAFIVMSAAVIASAPASAQEGVATPRPAPSPLDQRPPYVLGQGDVIETAVIGRTDFNARVEIQEDGAVVLPFVGTVQAAGRTPLELRNHLRARLIEGNYLQDPIVTVAIANFASRYVTVLGQVNQPGVVPMDRAYRLSEIVARAGGVSASADTIVLTRPDGSSQSLSLRAIAAAPVTQDPPVEPGDKVFVTPPATFYIYGEVNAPGAFPIERPMTVQMALARSGGLTALGSAKRVKLVRSGREQKVGLNEALRSDDVLIVGERFF